MFDPLRLKQPTQQLATAKFVVENALPFSVVETPSHRAMIATHNPQAKHMSNKKVKSIIINLDNAMRGRVIESMKGQSASFTLDHWTSKANENYTGITGHFIDDKWKLNSMSLGMFLHKGRTTSDELQKSFIDLHLNKLKLSATKVFSFTTDTTGNMNSFGRKLEDIGIAHIYCTDHVLQLTCKQCYEKTMEETFGPDFVGSVEKARSIVTFFNQSCQALEKLKKMQVTLLGCLGLPKGVVTDVVTRWWATFNMIARLLDLKLAIDALTAANELGSCEPLTPADWANLHDIMEVLKPFKEAQKLLEGDKYVTASWVAQAVHHIRVKLTKLGDPEMPESASRTLAASLLVDFNVRWRNSGEAVFGDTVQRGWGNRQIGIHPVLLLATFLDPRFKRFTAFRCANSVVAIKIRIKELMVQSETAHRQTIATPAAAAEEQPEQTQNQQGEEEKEDEDGGLFADMMQEIDEVEDGVGDADRLVVSIDDACEAELKRYDAVKPSILGHRNEDGKWIHSNGLDWWHNNETIFPTLARLARVYLAAQGTSAPSERVFSLASRIISSKRASMHHEMAGKTLFVSENWDWFANHLECMDEILERMAT